MSSTSRLKFNVHLSMKPEVICVEKMFIMAAIMYFLSVSGMVLLLFRELLY